MTLLINALKLSDMLLNFSCRYSIHELLHVTLKNGNRCILSRPIQKWNNITVMTLVSVTNSIYTFGRIYEHILNIQYTNIQILGYYVVWYRTFRNLFSYILIESIESLSQIYPHSLFFSESIYYINEWIWI